MKIELAPIGFVRTDIEKVPRHWTISDAEGALIVDEQYKEGLKDIQAGQRIVVLFYIHQSPRFTKDFLVQVQPQHTGHLGVFGRPVCHVQSFAAFNPEGFHNRHAERIRPY